MIAPAEALWSFWNMAEGTASNNDPKSDLRRIAELFSRYQVEFIVIGGQAETLMGSPRVTYDTDLCYRRTPENLQRLAAALAELKPTLRGAPRELQFPLDARALALGNNYTFETPMGLLDLLGWVDPIGDFDAVSADSEVYPVGDLKLRTISLDNLIRVKEHIRRPKDQSSLYQLLAIQQTRRTDSAT